MFGLLELQNKKYASWVLVVGLLLVAALPLVVFGQPSDQPIDSDFQLVPCGFDGARDGVENGVLDNGVPEGTIDETCNFGDLVGLAQRIINFVVFISVPIAAGLFSYAGFVYITAAGSSAKIAQAHTLFKNVAIGFIIVLGAWLLVSALVNALFNETIDTLLE